MERPLARKNKGGGRIFHLAGEKELTKKTLGGGPHLSTGGKGWGHKFPLKKKKSFVSVEPSIRGGGSFELSGE